MAASVRLSVGQLKLEWLADEAHEREPIARLWLSQNVSHSQREIKLPESLHRRPEVMENISMDFDLVPEEEAREMPNNLQSRVQHAYLNIDLFVRMQNKHGETCLNQSGSASIPVHELLAGTGSPFHSSGFTLKIPSWGDPNAHGANRDSEIINEKGTVWLRNVRLYLPDGRQVPALSRAEQRMHDKVQEKKHDILYAYMLSSVRFFRHHGYTWKSISDINAYVYQCRAGLFPACGYVGVRPGGTQGDYFERASGIVLKRFNIDPDTFDWSTDPRAAGVLARVLTLSANLLVYVPDLVYFPSASDVKRFLKRPLESFDYARARGGGDCEDLALEIIICGLELLHLEELGQPLHRSVQGLLVWRKKFVATMALGGVSSAEINGDYGHLKSMGAHMWSCIVQRTRWARWWRAGNLTEAQSALYKLPAPGTPDDPSYPAVMVLEGTGFLRPEGLATKEDILSSRMRSTYYGILNRIPNGAFSDLRQVFDYLRGAESPFYKTVNVLFTPEFMNFDKEARLVEFSVNLLPASTTGVAFADFTENSGDKVSLWALPAINAVESACIRDGMYNLPPLMPHSIDDTAGSTGLSVGQIGNKLFTPKHSHTVDLDGLREERLLKRIESEIGLGTKPIAGGIGESIPDVQLIDYYCKRGQLNESLTQRIIEACNSLGGAVVKVTCHNEPLAKNGLSAVRLCLHCKRLDKDGFSDLNDRINALRASMGKRPVPMDDYE